MKLLKYLAVVLVALAIVAVVVHQKRESIAREIANKALRGQGLTATELSIDTLSADRIALSHLVLLADNGTRYELYDVSFPLDFPNTRGNIVSIGELRLTPPEIADEPASFAQILQSFLALPELLPDTELTLSRFSMQDLPPLQNMVWRSATDSQSLSFDIDAFAVTAEFARESHDLHRAEIGATTGDAERALSLSLSIRPTQDGYSIDGPVAVQLAPWLPLLHTVGILPRNLAALDAGMTGPVSIDLHDEADVTASLHGDLTIDGTVSATYVISADSAIELRSLDPDRIAVHFAYPSLQWTADIPRSRLRVSTAGFADIPVSLSDFSCRSGVFCRMRVTTDGYAMAVGDTGIGNVFFSGTLELLSADETQLAFSPDFELRLHDVRSGALTIASLSTVLASGATVQLDDDGWRGDADKLELLLDSVSDGDGLLATLPVTISSLRLRDDARSAGFDFVLAPRAASISLGGVDLVVPGAAGKAAVDDGTVTTAFDLSDARAAWSGHIDGRYEPHTGRGSLVVQGLTLRFDEQKLSARLLQWPYPWDIVAGSWTTNLTLAFIAADDGWTFESTMTHSADSLAGHYNDIVFAGLASDLAAQFSPDEGLGVSPSSFTMTLLDVGIPIEQVAAGFAVDLDDQALDVTNLSMSALGGTIRADPFRYALQQDRNDIMLRPQSIQLQFMVDLAEFDDIELSGSISGTIPVTISDKTITVTNGRLESDAPGGVIRYRAGVAAAAISNEGIGVVSRALGNFQFDSLTSDVDYTGAGDLKLKMRLSGINPDMDALQPVILNLGVENNIPQLLRSLQATRAIEDILKRQGND